jgi:hypothetical protein
VSRRYFWGSAAGTAAIVGAGALLVPHGIPGLDTAAEQQRAWLLTVWTAGVMAICFGASGLLTAMTPIGFREVADAGSVPAAIEAHRSARDRQNSTAFYNFAGWTVTTGIFLLFVYLFGWLLGSN